MGYFGADPYNQPEALGLRFISSIDDPWTHEFNMLVVWQHIETGKLYWATDAGCSCSAPFEDYTALSDLTEITPGNWQEFAQAAREWAGEWRYDRETGRYEVTMMLARVSGLLHR
jgi:hypothetical protein